MIAVRTAPAIIPRTGFENIVRIPVNSGTFASGLTAPLIVSIPVIKIAKPIMMVPASILQLHTDVSIVADEAALSKCGDLL